MEKRDLVLENVDIHRSEKKPSPFLSVICNNMENSSGPKFYEPHKWIYYP